MSIPTWEEAAEEQFWEDIPQDLHEGAVYSYLGSYGDAIDARVADLAMLSQALLTNKYFGPSIAVSVTGLEVMIHYFCVRPIVEGALLSELLASEVSRWILAARSADKRRMLVAILRPWGIELEKLTLPSGRLLWETILSVVIKKRDAFLHQGDPPSEEDAVLALQCLNSFRGEVVLRIATRLGFTLEKTGCWSRVVRNGGQSGFGTADPFSKRGTPKEPAQKPTT